MRLRKIKVAGFKSFVDPTTIPLPGQLMGIVGPNGCGKSNVIDAVRWVMGESSAKQLRGDSMADVIFNGSTSRKPVSQAMVELVFDNNEGRLGGQYAAYSEISTKRTVSRDGQSHYYLNGVRCRRRDITDIFLGTGLGPRSYSIIEQGMISRIIESKPEDLRVFIEEAAGVSKYKERRRETETRIRHTRDNLDRLNDVRDELEKQITHLQRQAKAAEKYKALKNEERLLQAQLHALRWQALDARLKQVESELRDKETQLEAARAQQRHIETEIEKHRATFSEATDQFNQVQSRYYGVGSDIVRLEQSIQHTRERRQQQQHDLAQLEKDIHTSQAHIANDQQRIAQIQQELAAIEPLLARVQQDEQQGLEKLHQAEAAMQHWQQEWELFNQQAAEPARAADVERARLQQFEQQAQQLGARQTRLNQELQQLEQLDLSTEVDTKQQQLQSLENQLTQHQQLLPQQQQQITDLRQQITNVTQQWDTARNQLQTLLSKQASLAALQQAALGKQQAGVNQWLDSQNLIGAKRLAETLQVESGWERAVECVLGAHLEAVCVPQLDNLFNNLHSFSKGQITLIATDTGQAAAGGNKAVRLSAKIHTSMALSAMLDQVYVAADMAEAIALRTQLSPQESVVTRDGIWLGVNWLRIVKEQDVHSGVLQREQELKILAAQIAQAQEQIAQQQQRLEDTRSALHDAEHARDAEQAKLQQAGRQHAELKAQFGALQARLEQTRTRVMQLQQELAEVQQHLSHTQEQQQLARARQQQAQDLMGGHDIRREALQQQRHDCQRNLEQARSFSQQTRDQAHQTGMKAETFRTELTSLQQALQRIDSQQHQLQQRREELQAALHEADAPIQQMAQELDTLLKARVELETQLTAARNRLQEIEQQVHEIESHRSQAEEAVQRIRSTIEEIRLGSQETRVRCQTIEEQISAAHFQIVALLQELPPAASESQWLIQVEDVARKIERLGAINLAAIEEFTQQSERKHYLDAQHKDLTEALNTLEEAIQKIDRETRTRFKETYDKVNTKLQELFPRLFGGGHAYLELTGNDILETGIAVMARPPGKRNSTIHLLSGGEKALTAVALVFAIFELNPAPFCMLDEVDAPLDDANVGRYSDMLKHMSDRIQFIFITHNKVTMEVASHLTGVTMHEPGVSRLVAVDVDEAVKLAAV
ncbi:MAG: chromosome segregation protein SMC [Gammaproteobacteria bacterium]|nr:chromosome segregation protein SMC [Gammaproteobacteria bacterium]